MNIQLLIQDTSIKSLNDMVGFNKIIDLIFFSWSRFQVHGIIFIDIHHYLQLRGK